MLLICTLPRDDAPQVNPLDRLNTPVGHSIVLQDLQGQPVGDNIRSKGSLAASSYPALSASSAAAQA